MKYRHALKLTPDLFTPLARTPWAGKKISKLFKSNFTGTQEMPIGESWEVSCDPDFASGVISTDFTLTELIRLFPEAMLSPEYVRAKGPYCEILVKLIDADTPLSVQVHPTDSDPFLGDSDCGKPESWLVLDAEPGAGLYLGFSQAITIEEFAFMLRANEDIRSLLQFVPVQKGDFFEIQPGVPHAIGPGVVLLEPQRILFGKSGKTYRIWDWGRRYDEKGNLDSQKGKPRALHIVEALRIIDPENQVGEQFLKGLRKTAQYSEPFEGLKCTQYPENDYYQVVRLEMSAGSAFLLDIKKGFAAMVTLEGHYTCQGAGSGPHQFAQGEPGFLPHCALPAVFQADIASDIVLVLPQGANLIIKPLQ